MALVFELVVNCGPSERSAREFAETIAKRLGDVQVGNYGISLHQPLLDKVQDNDSQTYLVSIVPKNVGYGVGLDKGGARIPLTSSELTDLGNKLYDFIRGIPKYSVANVGWDIEWRVCYE